MLKGRYQEENLAEFNKSLPSGKYSQLIPQLQGSVFASIHLRDKKFSEVKYVKSYYRSAVIDEHLQSILMTGNSNFEPQLSKCNPPNTTILSISVPVLQNIMLSFCL